MLTLIKQYNPSTIIDMGRCHTFHTSFLSFALGNYDSY